MKTVTLKIIKNGEYQEIYYREEVVREVRRKLFNMKKLGRLTNLFIDRIGWPIILLIIKDKFKL